MKFDRSDFFLSFCCNRMKFVAVSRSLTLKLKAFKLYRMKMFPCVPTLNLLFFATFFWSYLQTTLS